jgi:hypothetical protein
MARGTKQYARIKQGRPLKDEVVELEYRNKYGLPASFLIE